MADRTGIEWTDATWNIVTGCTLVSEGCRHCYAATLAATRLKDIPSRAGLARINAAGEAKFTGEVRFNEGWLDQPLRWRKPRRVFVCAHGDLFHEAIPDDWIDRVFAVMALAPQHTFQVLTKRPERMRAYLNWRENAEWDDGLCRGNKVCAAAHVMCLNETAPAPLRQLFMVSGRGMLPDWPLPNVWLGVSVEDQAAADARIPLLLATPAAKRFISAEPLLGPVDLTEIAVWRPELHASIMLDVMRGTGGTPKTPPGRLDWVIAGGESGPGARPMHPDWPRALRDQCAAAGVPFFFKQWGEWGPDEGPPAKGRDRIMEGAAPCATLGDDGWTYHADGFTPDPFEGRGRWLYRLGKKAAGASLDGCKHQEFPA